MAQSVVALTDLRVEESKKWVKKQTGFIVQRRFWAEIGHKTVSNGAIVDLAGKEGRTGP